MTTKSSGITTRSAVLLVCAVSLALLAVGVSQQRVGADHQDLGAAATSVSVLDRAASPEVTYSGEAVDLLEQHFELERDGLRLAAVLDGARLYVAPAADDHICLIVEQPNGMAGSTCNTRAWLGQEGGILVSSQEHSAGGRTVYGLVSDRATAVRADGSSAESTVTANVFSIQLPPGVERLQLELGGITRPLRVP